MMNRRTICMLTGTALLSFALLPGGALSQQRSLKDLFVWPAISAEHTTVAPDLSRTWAREYLFFGSPDTGPGPIRRKKGPGQSVGDDSTRC
jgi:hypothetical protein